MRLNHIDGIINLELMGNSKQVFDAMASQDRLQNLNREQKENAQQAKEDPNGNAQPHMPVLINRKHMQMDANNLQEIEEKLQDSTVYLSVNKTVQSNTEVNDTDM